MPYRSLPRPPSPVVATFLVLATLAAAVGLVLAGVVPVGGAPTAGASPTAAEDPAAVSGGPNPEQGTSDRDGFGFASEQYRVDPPETAELDLHVPDGGVVDVLVASPGDHFAVEVTAGVPSGSAGQPTVRLDTGNVSADDPGEYLTVANATVHGITVHEHDFEGDRLPGGAYDVRAIRGTERASATLAVAPSVSLGFEAELRQSTLERDPVRTVSGETGLPPGEPIEIRITSTGQDAFRITTEAVVAEDGTFAAAVDLGPVPAGASFELTAHHDGITRARRSIDLVGDLAEPVDGRQVSNGITFAYEGEQLTLEAAPNVTITGETDLAAGTVVTIVLRSPESHLHVTTATVDSHGLFTAPVDLDEFAPRTDVIVSAVADGGASAAAPVAIVAPDDEVTAAERTTGGVVLDESGDPGGGAAAEPRLAGGVLALGLGVVLSLIASGLLLGVDPPAVSPRRE